MYYKNLDDYEIISRVRENDEDAVNIMIEKYEPIIISMAKKYLSYVQMYGADMDDLVQEGRIAVVKALGSYKNDGGSLFYTYVSVCVNRHFITYCRNLTRMKNSPLNYSVSDECLYAIGDTTFEPGTYLISNYDEKLFLWGKNCFDFIDSNIFELRYNGFSYKEISVLLDLPFRTVDSRLCKIRRTLQRMRNKF